MRFLPSDPQETPVRGVQPSARVPKVAEYFARARSARGMMTGRAQENRGVLMHTMGRTSWGRGAIVATGLVWAALFAGAWALSGSSHGSPASAADGLAPGQSQAVDASVVVRPAPRSHPTVLGVVQVPALPALRPRKAATRPTAPVTVAASAPIRSVAIARSVPVARFRAPVRTVPRTGARPTTPTAPTRTAAHATPTTSGTGTVSGGG